MDDNGSVMKSLEFVSADGSRGRERPPLRWKNHVGKDVISLGILW